MRAFLFSDEDLKAIDTDRYHHPHPHVQRKMEALWLKSHGLPHQQIADLTGVSLRTVQRYLDDTLSIDAIAGRNGIAWAMARRAGSLRPLETSVWSLNHPACSGNSR